MPVLVINVVGLSPAGIGENTPEIGRFASEHSVRTLQPPLPAVTCTSQATMTTGSLPREHGVVSNGWYYRDTGEVRFWQRSDRLVAGEKLWESARRAKPGIRTAQLFWRNCTHSTSEIVVTERPTYWADGRKGPGIYTEPAGLGDELVGELGEFPLFRFWGPATSIDSTRWIADATLRVMHSHGPELVLTYLPHLDYDLQKFGPASIEAARAHREVDAEVGRLIAAARSTGYDIAIVSEYGITAVGRPVFLNRILREAGLVRVQPAQNGELLEPGASRAFAACSHQVAHVYVADPRDIPQVQQLLEATDGVEHVLDDAGKRSHGLDHSRSGELIVLADADSWFAYPYWLDERLAPDFAHCVAIHDKPGHDPCEMFLGAGGKRRVLWRLFQKMLHVRSPFDVISTDASLIRGSHGRMPSRADDYPVLLTSWPLDVASQIAMTDVKEIMLKRLVAGQS